MGKYLDIRWKWLEERGFNVLADHHQYAYMQSLWTPVDVIHVVFCEAKAGTGKTTLATLAGAYEVLRGTYGKLVYVRNAVPVRDLGFLPGGLSEKEGPYMRPLIMAMDSVQPGLYEKWHRPDPTKKELPKLEQVTTAFTRGITWRNSFVIIDEAQTFGLTELQTIYTRCADDCKVVTVGSLRQNDNKRLKLYAGLTPFEIYMEHFRGTPGTVYHRLETNYRGWFSDHADDVIRTVEKLEKAGNVPGVREWS